MFIDKNEEISIDPMQVIPRRRTYAADQRKSMSSVWQSIIHIESKCIVDISMRSKDFFHNIIEKEITLYANNNIRYL